MTGLYRMNISNTASIPKYGRRAWNKYQFITRSLEKQGLSYSTEVQYFGETPWLLVRAWGEPKPTAKKQPRRCRRSTGSPLKLKQVRARVAEASKGVASVRRAFRRHIQAGLEPDWRIDYSTPTTPEQKRAQRQQGRKVARCMAIARGRGSRIPYAELDGILAEKMPRQSDLNAHEQRLGYWGAIIERYTGGHRRVGTYFDAEPREPADYASEYAGAKADLAFWKECEVLAGEREQWKPGRLANDVSDDQELAA